MRRSLVIAILVFLAPRASASWERVKLFLHAETQIVVETDDRLVIARETAEEKMQFVFTRRREDDSDIYGDYARRRGGNPYRIWVISEQLEEDVERPRRLWGRLLQAEFLQILKPPPANSHAR